MSGQTPRSTFYFKDQDWRYRTTLELSACPLCASNRARLSLQARFVLRCRGSGLPVDVNVYGLAAAFHRHLFFPLSLRGIDTPAFGSAWCFLPLSRTCHLAVRMVFFLPRTTLLVLPMLLYLSSSLGTGHARRNWQAPRTSLYLAGARRLAVEICRMHRARLTCLLDTHVVHARWLDVLGAVGEARGAPLASSMPSSATHAAYADAVQVAVVAVNPLSTHQHLHVPIDCSQSGCILCRPSTSVYSLRT
ncbi:hypothetical protein GGX14DRAFT_701827 [Mycena pura]|uniref:Uncharacterized protein n=1 Tax=Mycena pura TaxID=153505 RepID=A0AAD6UU83_9AGAR|nr:hypothetical protein GGX14DRAFT_701827 [Mycena pura]